VRRVVRANLLTARPPHSQEETSMTRCPTPLKPLAIAASLALLALASAQAQTAAPAAEPAKTAEDANDTLKMERIVVTGTSTARSKMKSSVSVSTLDTDQIQKSGASSAAEVLRSIPGIRSESSGGEGNANITVRGAPISAGGSRYLQLQEDGLPVLLFGDAAFGTADQFVRADYFLDTVQAVRGGSASTAATNSPAGIVNFISKTGQIGGGSAGLTVGLDHKQARLDFDVGGRLGPKTRFEIGGFQRIGEGPRNTNVTVEDGGQLRMNLTQEFDGGFVRVNFKRLDDKTPTYLPVPVRLSGNKIEQLPGVDPRTAFFINSNIAQDRVYDRNGNAQSTNPQDGLAVKNTSFGLELQADVGNGFTLSQKLRRSQISGRFIGAFPAGSAPTDIANGTNQYTGTTPVFSMHLFNTSLDDLGNVFSETKLAKAFDLGGGSKLTGTGGLFWGKQKVAETWYWNRYNVELKGKDARYLDNAGNPTALPVTEGTQIWGGCCARTFDFDVTTVAPFAALTYEAGPLSIDGSVRRDQQRGSGSYTSATGVPGVDPVTGNPITVPSPTFIGWNEAGRSNAAYKSSATSYSFGANFEFSRAMAVFARYSKGSSFAAPDRVVFGNAGVASGSTPYPINELKQLEAGLKIREGAFSGFFTFFNAKTKEDGGFEATTRQYLKDNYTANGIEAEMAWRAGPFNVIGGATLTKAKISGGSNDGKKPRRQADLVYQVTPSFTAGPFEVGASIVGTTKSYAQNDNQVVLPAYLVVNPFASYNLSDKLQLSLVVNNLFDKVGYTEAEGQGNLTNNPLYVARSINGRTTKATLKYSF
jgi:outer membrane receptor protein involved in Fe transport